MLVISEQFYSIQEGPFVGVPSVFLRLKDVIWHVEKIL